MMACIRNVVPAPISMIDCFLSVLILAVCRREAFFARIALLVWGLFSAQCVGGDLHLST